jgi:hypothetical protein
MRGAGEPRKLFNGRSCRGEKGRTAQAVEVVERLGDIESEHRDLGRRGPSSWRTERVGPLTVDMAGKMIPERCISPLPRAKA